MRYGAVQIVFTEIPNEISLALHITGCPLRCEGCHAADLWNQNRGMDLTDEHYRNLLMSHKQYITCVLFLGGEWLAEELISFLKIAKEMNFRTALYTGALLGEIKGTILAHLDYVKYGPYLQKYGPLSSKNTNQRLIHLASGEVLNHHFIES